MSNRTWHKGPPPHIGWWNASVNRNPKIWRWWNGRDWSAAATERFSAAYAGFKAEKYTVAQDIEWTDYWPEGARVPRVAP